MTPARSHTGQRPRHDWPSEHGPARGAVASVVIPAHDEERSIGRLLTCLTSSDEGRLLEVIVVCNGCSDETAERAAAFPGVQVLEIEEPSKARAMERGDDVASVYPRVYVDADVEIDAGSVLRLVDALKGGRVHACAPRRRHDLTGVTRLTRWYYDVWEELPQVREGLFGRGVVALSGEGHRRFERAPSAMNDDLMMSELFAPAERLVVESAHVVVRPARTLGALLRRRVRVRTGNAQADGSGWRSAHVRTRPSTLLRAIRRRPSLAVKLPVFVGVTLASAGRAKRAVRRGDFSTWLRDESSRS